MSLRILLMLLVLVATMLASAPAKAQIVTGADVQATCQFTETFPGESPATELDGGVFAVGPATCGLSGSTFAAAHVVV